MTATDEFASPASATGIKWAEHKDRLLLFTVHSQEVGFKTDFGTSDPVRADVVILDGAQAGEEIKDTLVFPKVLIGQLKANIGKKVLGRLGQGEAKPGQSAPWKLIDATDADRAVARAYVANNVTPPF